MARARTLTLKTKVEVTGADKLNNLGKKLQGVGSALTVGVTLPVAAIGGAMIQAAQDAEASEARFANVFRSMEASAWTTAEALDAQAQALAGATAFDDDAIRDLQGTLLTFGNVTGDAFTRATETALDMAQFFEGGASDAAIQLGKALNDPIKGISALTRVGVSFTDQQKENIKALVEQGDVAAAQGVILDELAREFGGAAEAFANTGAGQMKQAMNEIGEASEAFGEILLPIVADIASAVKDWAKWLRELNPEVKEWVVRIAAAAAALGPLLIAVGSVVRAVSTISTLTGKLPAGGLLARLFPVGVVAALADPVDEALGSISRNLHDMLGLPDIELPDWLRADLNPFSEFFLQVPPAVKQMTDAQWDAVEESGNAWAAQQNIISDAIYGTGGMVPTVIAGADDMAEEMGEAPGKMADELLAAQFRLTDATAQLVAFMEQAISPAQEMMELQGFLASNELANGLASNNPLIAQKSAEMRDAALSRLAELQGQAWTYGNNVGTSFAAGMNAAYGWVRDSAGNLAAAARGQIGINSEPDDPNSPLHGITEWGANIAKTLAAGMASGVSVVQGAAGRLAGAAAIGSTVGVSAVAPAAGGGGGMTINNFYLQWDGEPPRGRSEGEIVATLQRLSPLIGGKLATGYG